MDLGFHSAFLDGEPLAVATDLRVLIVAVTARQAVSPTALAQQDLGDAAPPPVPHRFAPADGSFNGLVAVAITRWKRE